MRPVQGNDFSIKQIEGEQDKQDKQETTAMPRNKTRKPPSVRNREQPRKILSTTAPNTTADAHFAPVLSSSSAPAIPHIQSVAVLILTMRSAVVNKAWDQLSAVVDKFEAQGLRFDTEPLLSNYDAQAMATDGALYLLNAYGDAISDTAAQLCMRLIRLGCHADVLDENDNSLLMLASKAGHADLVEALILECPELNRQKLNNKGKNAAMLARDYGNLQVLPALQRAGISLTPPNPALSFYQNKLQNYSQQNKHSLLLEFRDLIKSDHYMNLPDANGQTLIMHAVINGQPEIVQFLCERADVPDLRQRDHAGNSVFDYAARLTQADEKAAIRSVLHRLVKDSVQFGSH